MLILSSYFKLLNLLCAVPVGGKNFFKLMQNGEAALLYPGGVSEVNFNICALQCRRSETQNHSLVHRFLFSIVPSHMK